MKQILITLSLLSLLFLSGAQDATTTGPVVSDETASTSTNTETQVAADGTESTTTTTTSESSSTTSETFVSEDGKTVKRVIVEQIIYIDDVVEEKKPYVLLCPIKFVSVFWGL